MRCFMRLHAVPTDRFLSERFFFAAVLLPVTCRGEKFQFTLAFPAQNFIRNQSPFTPSVCAILFPLLANNNGAVTGLGGQSRGSTPHSRECHICMYDCNKSNPAAVVPDCPFFLCAFREWLFFLHAPHAVIIVKLFHYTRQISR